MATTRTTSTPPSYVTTATDLCGRCPHPAEPRPPSLAPPSSPSLGRGCITSLPPPPLCPVAALVPVARRHDLHSTLTPMLWSDQRRPLLSPLFLRIMTPMGGRCRITAGRRSCHRRRPPAGSDGGARSSERRAAPPRAAAETTTLLATGRRRRVSSWARWPLWARPSTLSTARYSQRARGGAVRTGGGSRSSRCSPAASAPCTSVTSRGQRGPVAMGCTTTTTT